MKASDFLSQAQAEMQDRAKTYDNPNGERSMQATVAAFNAICGLGMATTQGWLFMALLKAVRTQQGAYRSDSYTDMAAYAALMGECAAAEDLQIENLEFCTEEISQALKTPDLEYAMKDYVNSEKYSVTFEEEEAWASLKQTQKKKLMPKAGGHLVSFDDKGIGTCDLCGDVFKPGEEITTVCSENWGAPTLGKAFGLTSRTASTSTGTSTTRSTTSSVLYAATADRYQEREP